MDFKHHLEHRVFLGLYLLLSILISYGAFTSLRQNHGQEIASVIGFTLAIASMTFYQWMRYERLTSVVSRVNSLTQLWFGYFIILASLMSVVLHIYLGVEFAMALIIMVFLLLAILFLTVKQFDAYLERRVVAAEVLQKEQQLGILPPKNLKGKSASRKKA